ncbi:hypothetical protein [Thalassobellus citreus]|uniref:hypothetical protein n=1 Tax=Thalassobellus citreus TaxID=3367752 RepID=UPI00379932A4
MKQITLHLFIVLASLSGYSQLVIGTATPDGSSVLDVTSTTQDFLPPRMVYDDMVGILTPAEGLVVYCLDCDPKGLYYYDGTDYLSTTTGVVTSVIPTVPPPTVLSSTGQIWMDRNLGAQQVATASNDHLSYGDLYQWGRGSDGHQTIVWISSTASDSAEQSNDTETLATTAEPSDGNAWDGKFIKNDSSPHDWLTTPDVTLWQGVSGTNNPCPSGFRIPSAAELNAERNNGGTGFWGTGSVQNNSAGAYASVLKLPVAGGRSSSTGALGNVGSRGFYWSSSVSGTVTRCLGFNFSDASIYPYPSSHANGFSVRCIKD